MALAAVGFFIAGIIIVPVRSAAVLLSMMALLTLAARVRTLRLGVCHGPKGVVIRSFLLSQRIRWPDIVDVGGDQRANPRYGPPSATSRRSPT